MTARNFEVCLPWVLVHEGGYVNHRKDPGGATNRGVTQRTYNAYRSRMGLQPRNVRQITEEEVQVIYREQYWDAICGGALPSGVDYAVFDFAVNSGPRRAAKFLQRALGVGVDGHIGLETLAAANAADPVKLVAALCRNRLKWVSRLRTFKTFGRGWTRRIMGEAIGAQDDDIGVIDRATMLARNASGARDKLVPIPAPKAAAPGKAEDRDIGAFAIVSDAVKKPAVLSVLGAVGSTVATVATSSGPVAWSVAALLLAGGGYAIYRLERGRVAT